MDRRPDDPSITTRRRSALGASSARAAGVVVALLVLLLAGLGDRSGIVTGTGVVTPVSVPEHVVVGSGAVPDIEFGRDLHDDGRAANLSLHHTAMQARGALGGRSDLLVLGLLALLLLALRARRGPERDSLAVAVGDLARTRPSSARSTARTSRGPPVGAL